MAIRKNTPSPQVASPKTAPACKVPASVSFTPASFLHHSGLHSHDAF